MMSLRWNQGLGGGGGGILGNRSGKRETIQAGHLFPLHRSSTSTGKNHIKYHQHTVNKIFIFIVFF